MVCCSFPLKGKRCFRLGCRSNLLRAQWTSRCGVTADAVLRLQLVFITAGSLIRQKRGRGRKSVLPAQKILLDSALISAQDVTARRLPHFAGSKIQQQIHLPLLKDSPFRAALDQFLNQIVELSEVGGLNEAVSHRILSAKEKKKCAFS